MQILYIEKEVIGGSKVMTVSKTSAGQIFYPFLCKTGITFWINKAI